MINKLIANIAFSPNLIEGIDFYSKRLNQESSVRKLGLIFIVLAMLVQMFAASVPAEKSLAASDNDVIGGGVDTIGQLKNSYDNHGDVRALYNRFGLNGNHLNANGGVQNTSFNFQEQGSRGTRTVGRINFTSTNDNYLGNLGGSNFYSRSAAEWHGETPAYYFGRHQGTDGNYYYVWVLKDCGNIAYRAAEGPDSPPPPDTPPPPVVPPESPPPPPPPETPPPPPVEAACIKLSADITTGVKSVRVRFDVNYYTSHDGIVRGFNFDLGDGPSNIQGSSTIYHTYTNDTDHPLTFKAFVTVLSDVGDKRSPACEVTITVLPEECAQNPNCTIPRRTKIVQNITQGLSFEETLLTKARASDTIEYSLITANSSAIPNTTYTVEDYIGDLLNYASLDKAFLEKEGGQYDSEKKTIIWTNQAIPAKGELKKTFRVILKNPLPSTNRPHTISPDFDCKMQNGYGNEVFIDVDCAVIKKIEQLPNTGPGETIGATFAVTFISSYFFARSRLLAKELKMVKNNYRSSSGV